MTPSPNDLADTGGRDVAAAGHGWQLLRLPVRSDFDPELSKRDLARMWRCSTKTIERYMDPAYVRPRGLRPLPKGNHQSLWTPIRALWWGKLSEARRRELVDFDWHSLRHFTAHYFYVVRGFGAELAAYQLGHTDPHLVIRRYGKPFQGALYRLKRAADGPRVVPLRVARESQADQESA